DPVSAQQWDDPRARGLGSLRDGRAQPAGIRRRRDDTTLLLLLSAHHDVVSFCLPQVTGGSHWLCLLDTSRPELRDGEQHAFASEFLLTGRSVLLLRLEREKAEPSREPPVGIHNRR